MIQCQNRGQHSGPFFQVGDVPVTCAALAMCTAFGGAQSWRQLSMKTQWAQKGQIGPQYQFFKIRNHASFIFM